MHRVDGPLLVLNLKVLLWTALVPFPTAVIAEHLGEGGEPARTAVVLYGAYSSWIVRAAPAAVHGRRGRLQLALALAFVSPPLALALHGAIAL